MISKKASTPRPGSFAWSPFAYRRENDGAAAEVLAEAFPGREILPVAARAIIVGGGNVHCITQQIPEAI